VLQGSGAALVALGLSRTVGFGKPRDLQAKEQEHVMSENKASGKPTIVLVHGAFADASGWNEIISMLLTLGYPVVAASNPLRSLTYDAAYVASILASIKGPIVLVGHSYGGMVISGAAKGNAKVKALVYICADAPEVGESAFDVAGRFLGSEIGPNLAPPVPQADGANDLYIQQEKFHALFCPDVPEPQARRMAATQRAATDVALYEKASAAAWKTIPSWYLVATNDEAIPPFAQRLFAQRMGATTEEVAVSHVPMVSQPEVVAKLIMKAAQAV